MAKKQSVSRVPAPLSQLLYNKLTPREVRVQVALGQDKKAGQMSSKK